MSIKEQEALASARNLGRWTVILLTIGGMAAAWYLVEHYIQAILGKEVGGAVCRAYASFDCEGAATSSFAALGEIPIALLGLCFYAGIFLIALFDRESIRVSERAFRPAALAVSLFGLSLIYSLFLAGVSAFSLKSFCPFCVMLYLINGLGFVAALTWAGRSPAQILGAQIRDLRGLLSGTSGLFLFAFGFVLLLGVQTLETALRDGAAEMNRRQEAAKEKVYEPGDYRLSDAPAKGPADAPVHITVFSTFPCSYCAAFALVLDVVEEKFPEELRIEYRYFPAPTQEDGQATAYGAHCSGEQGKFWPMHDLLFARAPEHGPEKIREYARELGLDQEAFEQCLKSPETRARVEVDVQAGLKLGIDGTPVFFINGKKIEGSVPVDLMLRIINEELESVQSAD